MKFSNAQLHTWLIILAVAMLTAVMQLYVQHLYYTQSSDGDWYRWFSAHFVHADWRHWTLNMVAWALVPLAAKVVNRLLIVCLLLLPWCISAGFYLSPTTDPTLAYVGMSGVLHGVYMALGLYGLLRRPNLWDAVLCAGLVVKLLLDVAGVSLTANRFVDTAYVPAHVLGVVFGALLALAYWALGYFWANASGK